MTTQSCVLIVEDTELAAWVLTSYCQNLGFAVDHAPGVNVASELLVQKQYRLILMDLGLGDGDGKVLTEWIRKETNLNQQTPIIVQSAHMNETLKRACLEAGANEVFVKPLNQTILEKLLKDNQS